MTLVFRISVSAEIGIGHFMRCLALAEEARRRGHTVRFLCSAPQDLETRAVSLGIPCLPVAGAEGSHEDALQTQNYCRWQYADWLIIDGYSFRAEYCGIAGSGADDVCLLDDNGEHADCAASIFLNANLHGAGVPYPAPARVLAGPRYALLRNEFLHGRSRDVRLPARLLVTMGGSDLGGWTPAVLAALGDLRELVSHTTVIVGPLNPRGKELRESNEGAAVTVIFGGGENMAEYMRESDFAVSAAGSTVYELCRMGVPFLLCVTADNQRGIADWFRQHGLAEVCAQATVDAITRSVRHALVDLPRKGARLSRDLQALVDGRGASRVLDALELGRFRLRSAAETDCTDVYRLSNDPEVRANSINSDPISWESHEQWFARRLEDPHTLFYVVEAPDGSFAGQLRFQLSGDVLIASVSLTEGARGKGVAASLLRQGSEVASTMGFPVEAQIRSGNVGSITVFRRAGYSFLRSCDVQSVSCEIYRYGCSVDVIQDPAI